MPYTATIAREFVQAVHDQMERCPGCFGVGKVRQSGDYQASFCLVCEEVAKVMYLIGRDWSWQLDYTPRFDNERTYDEFKELFDRLLREARDFGKRCPRCYGIRKVWAAEQPRKCFVCERFHAALEAYERAVNPAGSMVVPVPFTNNADRRIK